ncbi:MAG TPA: hypothetical protein VJJ81_01065 [Candidatus Babeliales bacterium]|nr:hypothetical protein [Candidatus Babeliales bacterium]
MKIEKLMKETVQNKRSLAWFKLTEFVIRGEKERALGIYRLLALSIDNKAFAQQLEGDLLLAFDDPVAEEKYLEAAQLYLEAQQPAIAIAIYEHLINLVLLLPEQQSEYKKNKLAEILAKLAQIDQDLADKVKETLILATSLDYARDEREKI